MNAAVSQGDREDDAEARKALSASCISLAHAHGCGGNFRKSGIDLLPPLEKRVDDGYVSEPLYERVLSILKKIGQVISRIVRSIELIGRVAIALLLFGMIAIAASQVILRNVFGHWPVLGGWLGPRLIALGCDVRGNGRIAQ